MKDTDAIQQAESTVALEQTLQQPEPVSLENDIKKLPRVNKGALLMPGVWGPAHGQWITVLFYPIWLFCDISFCNAAVMGGLAIVLAGIVFLGTAAVTLFFAATAGKRAYLRVSNRVTVEQYLRRERWWILISALIAVVFIAFATWYNLAVRLPAGLDV